MQWYEILIIIAAISFVLGNIAVYVYKKVKHLPTGSCEACHNTKRMNKRMNNLRKELDKEFTCNCK
ncbi:MAG: DUF2897 family protein [Acholeplasmatales bacterium]|nr:DUF2897 family protein [Acholeplasmatales bacterium]